MALNTLTPRTATSIIIANMVGMGVFTSLGFQLDDISTAFALLILWVIGFVAVICRPAHAGPSRAEMRNFGGDHRNTPEDYLAFREFHGINVLN